MNMNTYPHSASEKTPDTAELEYRAELEKAIIDASTGSVALYTSLDLAPDEVEAMNKRFAERESVGTRVLADTHGGLGEYGEIAPDRVQNRQNINNDLLEPQTMPTQVREEIAFIKAENNETVVSYRFKPTNTETGYLGSSGRPNALNLSFSLPPELAADLQKSLSKDPSYVQDIVMSQLAAIGVSRSQQLLLKPHLLFEGGPKNIPDHKLQITEAQPNGERTVIQAAYADKQPLLPDRPAEIAAPETTPEDIADQNRYAEVEAMVARTLASKSHLSPEEQLAYVQDIIANDYEPEELEKGHPDYLQNTMTLLSFKNAARELQQQIDAKTEQAAHISNAQTAVAEALSTTSPEDIADQNSSTEIEAMVASTLASRAYLPLTEQLAYIEDIIANDYEPEELKPNHPDYLQNTATLRSFENAARDLRQQINAKNASN